jgi:hypothetical protein
MPRLEDVVPLARLAARDLGLQPVTLESIVGTVERRNGEFDRLFQPRFRRLEGRWQPIAGDTTIHAHVREILTTLTRPTSRCWDPWSVQHKSQSHGRALLRPPTPSMWPEHRESRST